MVAAADACERITSKIGLLSPINSGVEHKGSCYMPGDKSHT